MGRLIKDRNRFIRFFVFGLIYSLPGIVFSWLVMGPYGEQVAEKNTRAVLFIGLAVMGTLILRWQFRTIPWPAAFASSLLAYGVVHRAFVFLPDISSYPLSLGWSEASRYYYASLFFAKKIYGQSVPLSVLHPTRYLMQSVPFLLPETSLWMHRSWQVLLWLGMSFLTGWIIARRFGAGWWLAAFSILFLFEGPVYYHLLMIVFLVMAGVRPNHFFKTLIVVVLVSIWAGISRINWYPMPGLLASLLYFFHVPVTQKNWVKYAVRPAVWTIVGTGTAFLTQMIYIRLSGNPIELFSSSFTSDLLWYRLWPNITYGPGIVRSMYRITFPMLLIILARWLPNWRRIHFVRILGILAINLVLLAGGIVVSVKIGGGSNLHNLDAFLVTLLVVTAAFYMHKVVPDGPRPMRAQGALWVLVFFALLYPIRDVTKLGGPLPVREMSSAWHEVNVVKSLVEEEALSGGEVLFINQRHLLSTGIVEEVPLVPDYEVVFLMEMAMGNNRFYLDRFEQDLKDQKFGYILGGNTRIQYQDDRSFAEENNVWVERITVPMLCYYQISVELPHSGISILKPRAEPCESNDR